MSGFRLFRVRGVPVTLHPTALLLAGLFGYSAAYQWQGAGAAVIVEVALISILVVFVSILLHELGHVAAARAFGIHAADVTLWGLGGMARLQSEPATPGAAVGIAAAGPAVSVALGVTLTLASGAAQATGAPATGRTAFLLGEFGAWNLFIGLFNLLPGPPLDGGGILAGIVWAVRRDKDAGRRVAAYTGLVAAAAAVVLAFRTSFGDGYRPTLVLAAALLVLGSLPQLSAGRRPAPLTPPDTGPLERLTRLAGLIAARSGHTVVGSEHLLLALLASPEDPACAALQAAGLDYAAAAGLLPAADGPVEGNVHLSDGARRVLRQAVAGGADGVGVVLALDLRSPAGVLCDRLGIDLAGVQARLRSREDVHGDKP